MSSNVTIIIPCYGQAEYLLDAVNSCRRQTTQPDEIIAILMDEDSWKLKDQLKDITCVIQPRLNVPVARNIGFSKAKTDFVINLDADDMLPDNYLEEILKHKNEADVIYTGIIRFGYSNKITEPPPRICKALLKEPFTRVSIPPSCLFRKKTWKEVGGYNEDFTCGHDDGEMTIRLFTSGKSFASCSEVKLLYRKYPPNANIMSNKCYENRNLILDHLKRLYPKIFSNYDGPFEERKDYTLKYEEI